MRGGKEKYLTYKRQLKFHSESVAIARLPRPVYGSSFIQVNTAKVYQLGCFGLERTTLHLLSVHFANFSTSSGVTASFFNSSSSVIVFFAFDCLAKNPPPFFFARPVSSFELDDLPLIVNQKSKGARNSLSSSLYAA